MPENFSKSCPLCAEQIKKINYKDIDLLRQCLSPYGRILPRRRTSLCAKHQRQLARAIKRARYLALLPFTTR